MSANSLDVKFDMSRPPIRQRWFLRPITWAVSFPTIWSHRLKIQRKNLEGLKPPYILLCTHMAFIDFMVTTAAIFPHRGHYVVAIDGFIGREWLLRNVGAICKRKFTSDITLVRQIKKTIDRGDILVLYPEARYSLAGTTAVLPDSLGKMVRLAGAPVAVLNMHGNYLSSPCWNLKKRKVPLAADFTQILTVQETKSLPVEEINCRIRDAFAMTNIHGRRIITFKSHIRIMRKVCIKYCISARAAAQSLKWNRPESGSGAVTAGKHGRCRRLACFPQIPVRRSSAMYPTGMNLSVWKCADRLNQEHTKSRRKSTLMPFRMPADISTSAAVI